jgi:hypothetical protein
MSGLVVVLGCVPAQGAVAAADVSALRASAQVHPAAARFETLDASVAAGLCRDDGVEVSASFWHADPSKGS